MILIEVTINSVLNRLSMEGIALTHWWDNKVMSFDPPVYSLSERSGGYCSLDYGSMSFSPDLFENDWPPPVNCAVTVYFTETTEAAKQIMFEGTLHLSTPKNDEITYDFYGEDVDFDLLDEDYAYDEDAIEVVKAATYKWTVIGATSEYYCELLAGGDPEIVEPEIIFEDDTAMTEGSAVGALAVSEWIYDDPGTGWDTIIVRITGSVDPDTKADGYLRAGYTDEKVPLPRAFGRVNFVEPLRLANAKSGNYRYNLGEINTGGYAISGSATATAANKLIDSNAEFSTYGVAADDIVYNTTDSTTAVVVSTDSETQLTLDSDIFVNGEKYKIGSCGDPIYDGALTTVHWCVYDDGVDISSNVTNTDSDVSNIFELTSAPVGTVTISGFGQETVDLLGGYRGELSRVFNWAATRASYSLNTDITHVAATPSVHYWADKQIPLIDFLDKVSRYFAYMFYLRDGTIYLVDMSLDNGTATLDNYDFMETSLEYPKPISQITAEWKAREPGEWSEVDNPGTAAGVYVRETDQKATVKGSYRYGDEIDISDVFSDPRQNINYISIVNTYITDILAYEEKPDIEVLMPLTGTLPLPAKKLTITDTTMKVSSTMIMHVREIHYDIEENEIKLIGEGSIATT